jgi:hypothetical protein
MSDEKEPAAAVPASEPNAPPTPLIYESNLKHTDPWQVGRRGSICETEVRPLAGRLLAESVEFDGKRYAVHAGPAYCAQEHEANRWHGYPVGWVEVPAKLVRQWINAGVLRNHDRKKYWEAH